MDSLQKISFENEIFELKALGSCNILKYQSVLVFHMGIVPCTSVCGRVSLTGALDLSVPLLAEVLSLCNMHEWSAYLFGSWVYIVAHRRFILAA